MANICRNFAILGFDTRKDCIDSTKIEKNTIAPEKNNLEPEKNLEVKIDTGDVLAVIFGMILLASAFAFVYFTGRKMLSALNKFLAACQRTVDELRKRATRTVLGDKPYEKPKKSKTPKSTEKTKTNVKVKSEKPKQKKGQKEKKVKIQAPNPPNATTTANTENVVTVTAIVEPEIPMVSETFQ